MLMCSIDSTGLTIETISTVIGDAGISRHYAIHLIQDGRYSGFSFCNMMEIRDSLPVFDARRDTEM